MSKHPVFSPKKERSAKGTSLQRRLFIFFIFATTSIIIVFFFLLLISGITGGNTSAVYNYTSDELSRFYDDISYDFGNMSLKGVELSQDISKTAQIFFDDNFIEPEGLKKNPELIEPFLSQQIHTLTSVMDTVPSSGAFIILDASVSPDNSANNTRSGIFIKKTQPNTISSVGSKLHYLRGPAAIARENGIELLGQWKMEFDTEYMEFFDKVITTARDNPKLPLTRLYYWSERITLKGNSESGFLLCVPIISDSGNVYGICGIEVSDRLFKRSYSPENNKYADSFASMSPVNDTQLLLNEGMIAGNYYLTGQNLDIPLTISNGKGGFFIYESGETRFGGIHHHIKLYPTDSPYYNTDKSWAVSVMMPLSTLFGIMQQNNIYLIIIICALFAAAIVVSVFISRKYLHPVTKAINDIKTKDYSPNPNTPYIEINDLMEFLAKRDERSKFKNIEIAASSADTAPMFNEFLKNIKTLSPAEKNVFELYLKGYNAKEISETLFLSINTIKTHNRRIFSKLNVSSRKELLVYIDMMKELNIIESDK